MVLRHFIWVLCLALHVACGLQAQNWQPLSSSETSYFQEAGQNVITNSIEVVDRGVVNGDSVFYLSRVMKPCDTCQITSTCQQQNADFCFMLRDQSQFIKGKMIARPGGIYEFKEPGTFVLNSWAQLNTDWLWNPETQDIAEVVYLSTENVFGTLDSVKTILISNGDSIRLSKNHGILFWQNNGETWSLEGIRGRNLGNLLPNMKEMFDIKPGDILQFEEVESFITPNGIVRDTFIYKDYINSKSVNGYQIQLEVTRHFRRAYFDGFSTTETFGQSNEILVYSDSAGHPANMNPGQKARLDGRLNPASNLEQLTAGIPAFQPLRVYRDSEGNLTKELGVLVDSQQNSSYSSFYRDSVFVDVMPRVGGGDEMEYFLQYKEGLGFTYEKWEGPESSHYLKLTAYVMDEDTVGTLLEDQFLTSEQDPKTTQFSFGPNPGTGNLVLNAAEGGKLRLLDVQGRELFRTEVRAGSKEQFHFERFGNGLFFLELQTEDAVLRKKLLIQH